MRTKDLAEFILERERVRLAKEAGKPQPWTQDAILATYRFCNVHREDDKVTRWIAENWRDEGGYKDIWFAMVFARLFNLPSTLAAVGRADVMNWKPEKVRAKLHQLRAQGPIFNGAYIVSTNGVPMDKVEYLITYVLGPLWAHRAALRPQPGDTLASYHAKLMQHDGLGSFMAAQVVADLKYVEPLKSAEDWWTWAASGPGSRRGLNRVCEHPPEEPWHEPQWFMMLTQLRAELQLPKILYGAGGKPVAKGRMELHAQDLQNCLCEFDKYERVRLGEGRPKQLYRRAA